MCSQLLPRLFGYWYASGLLQARLFGCWSATRFLCFFNHMFLCFSAQQTLINPLIG
jgi:hypothetical protein